MENANLTITISGRFGNGKTSVALAIQKMLNTYGVQTVLKDIDIPSVSGYIETYFDDNLTALGKNKLICNIETVQVQR